MTSVLLSTRNPFRKESYWHLRLADEWDNFLERMKLQSELQIWNNDEYVDELRHWASYRGQTLSRTGKELLNSPFLSNNPLCNAQIETCATCVIHVFITWRNNSVEHWQLACCWLPVRGMMYYRRALELQAFLDMASEEGNALTPYSSVLWLYVFLCSSAVSWNNVNWLLLDHTIFFVFLALFCLVMSGT
jgi:hypothetical protein